MSLIMILSFHNESCEETLRNLQNLIILGVAQYCGRPARSGAECSARRCRHAGIFIAQGPGHILHPPASIQETDGHGVPESMAEPLFMLAAGSVVHEMDSRLSAEP
jgi:hypothetical protein